MIEFFGRYTFIWNRHIMDNILIAYELTHALKAKRIGKEGYTAMKLDMSKAYDRVEWSFIEKMMKRMGFPESWISRVMTCVSTVSYLVLLNGFLGDYFSPQRRLRQGDPLSPYLFVMCTEVLSSIIYNTEIRSEIRGLRICKAAPMITHLFFADDSLFFLKATE